MWESRYAASESYLFGEAPAQFLVENPGWVRPGAEVLAVADGEGRNSVWMAGRGARVTAFDLSPTAVERARALAERRGVSLDVSVSAWEEREWESGRFDLVAAIFIQFFGPEGRARQFADIARALKPGGVLMLHGYRPEQLEYGTGGPPFAENMYTESILREAFGDWDIWRLASYERDVQEGRGHVGKSALIDLIAKKPDSD